MSDIQKFGDLKPREAGYAWKELLKRAIPGMVTEMVMQTKPLPKKNTGTVIFRRYNRLEPATAPLAEGVTPGGSKPTYTDVTVTLQQFGDYIQYSDVMEDLHPDNVIQEYSNILSEQMAETKEVLNISVLKSGTTIYYANGAQRTDVNTFTTVGQLKKIVRFLRTQKAKPITKILKSTPNYASLPVQASYVAFCDTDCVADLEALPGFKTVEQYGNPDARLSDYEVGAVANIRFIATSLFDAWPDAGAADATATMIGTTLNTSAVDVYPIIIMGEDAACTVPLRGANSGYPIVNSTKPDKSDPLGQRGSVGWKMWHAGGILQDLYMARLEVSCTLNPVS